MAWSMSLSYIPKACRHFGIFFGKCHRVVFDARYLSLKPLDAEGDDVRFKSKVARWINEAWKEKDARISHHLDAAVIE